MDLQTLTFKVETSDLTKAVVAVNELGTAVSKLNKPVKENTATTEQATKATKENTTVLQRQQDILKFMTEGYSKGQASVMAYAKASGALAGDIDMLGKTLKTQRTLMGTDPFDKSIGALQTLRNEYKMVNEVQNLYNQNLGLTKGQMETLAREKQRLIALYEIEGKNLKGLDAEYKLLVDEATKIAQAENAIASSMRSKDKAINDTAKANAYLTKEMNRLDSALKETNKDLSSGSNNALLRFEAALKNSGKTASEQIVALENYRQKLLSVNKASGNKQVDYLARALGPQITDIFTGLATGQNPMTVLLQQGGQLRDQLALAGVAGKDIGKALTDSAKGMISSIKDVAVAVGNLLVTAVVGAGKSIIDFVVTPFKLMGTAIYGAVTGTKTLAASALELKAAFMSLSTAGILLVITALAAIAVEGYKFLSLQSELSKSIALTGASLGMSTQQAIALAESMSEVGGSTFEYMRIINEFAKANAKADETTIKLAKDMDKYLGKAASQTAQEIAKISDKPLAGLIEVAKATGYVSKATLDNVNSLTEQGKTYQAIKVAQEAYIDANNKVIQQAKADLTPIQLLWIKIKENVTSAGEAVFKLATSGAVVKTLTVLWNIFASAVASVWMITETLFKGILKLPQALGFFKDADTDLQKVSDGFNQFMDKTWGAEESVKGLTEAEVKLREEQAAAAKTAEERWAKEKEALSLYKSTMANFNNISAGASTEQKVLNKAQTDYIALLNNPAYKNFSQAMKDNANVEAKLASVMLEMQKGRDYRKEQNLILAEENANLKLQTNLIGMTDTARIRANSTRKAEAQLIKDIEEIEKYQLDDEAKWKFKADAYQRYSDRVKNISTEIDNTFKIERMNAYGTAFQNVFDGMADAIVTFAQTGKLSFKGLIDAMLTDLIRFEMRAQMTAVYRSIGGAQGIMNFFTGGTGANAPDNIDAGGGWSPAQAKGGAWSDGMQMFAKGGSFTNSIVDSPTLFKFAKGTGMMGEAGPEAIMPLRRGPDGSLGVQSQGGGSNVSVNVINNSNAQATTSETTDARGNREIQVIIGDMTANEIQRNGSTSQKAMKSTFGVQPALIRR